MTPDLSAAPRHGMGRIMLPAAPPAVKRRGYVFERMRRFPVIVGPTAGGKSAVAMALAALLQSRDRRAEIISADAFQVYRGMDIGTAKPGAEDRAAVPHHLIDIRNPTEPFTVDEWLNLAEKAIQDIRSRDGAPIVVGGTHLYVKALLEGLFEGPPPDPALRASLQRESPQSLRARLERVDPVAALRIHPNDLRRTIRALEVHQQTGLPISQLQRQWDVGRRDDAQLVVLEWPTDLINQRINARVKEMRDVGLADEVRLLWESGRLGTQAREAIGYRQLIDHFERRVSLDDAFERIKIETRRFAKNQRTWLRRLAVAPTDSPTPIQVPAGDLPPDEIAQTIFQQVV